MQSEVKFGNINFEDNKKLIFISDIYCLDENGEKTNILEETDFIHSTYSGFDSARFNKSEDRVNVKIQYDPNQQSSIKLRERMNYFDNQFEGNKQFIFGKYHKAYNLLPSVKSKKQELEFEDQEDADVKLDNSKFKLSMKWKYYYNDEKLSNKNTTNYIEAIQNALKSSKPKTKEEKEMLLNSLNIQFELYEDDKIVKKMINYKDIVQRKEIATKVWYRRPESLDSDAKDVLECSEEEIIKYYGEPELMDVKTPEDLDKYFNYNCYTRYKYSPNKFWANKNAGLGESKRLAGITYEIKELDIIQKPYNKNKTLKGLYSSYSFGINKSNLVIEDTVFTKSTDNNSSKSTSESKKSIKIESESSDDSDESESEAESEDKSVKNEEVSDDSSDSESEEESEKPPVIKSKKKKTEVVEEKPKKTKEAKTKTKKKN